LPRRRRGILAALTVILLAAGGLAAALAGPARAVTATCTNIAHPVAAPVGCGGIFLPLLGTGIQPDATSLTMTAAADFWNAPVTVTPYNPADAHQDFTVYQVCTVISGPRTAAAPCGTAGTAATDPLSGLGEYTAEATPLGAHLGGGPNTPGNLCLSTGAVRDGPLVRGRHAVRWHVVLRTCDTGGAAFTDGTANAGADNGTPGVVTHPNLFQTWSPVPGGNPACTATPCGYVLANNALSNHFHTNTPFVLDARGGRGPALIAFPENDNRNQIWKVIGCTNPVTALTPGYFACP
jgi:hypothetical protein